MNFRAPIDSGYPDLTVIADKDAVVTADGLAVDWVYNHVYWTDTGIKRDGDSALSLIFLHQCNPLIIQHRTQTTGALAESGRASVLLNVNPIYF